MKKNWTRLWEAIKAPNNKIKESKFKKVFCEHHRYADLLAFNKEGQPLLAVYYTPLGDNQANAEAFFARIARRQALRPYDYLESPDE